MPKLGCYVGTAIRAPDPVELYAGLEYEVQAILHHPSIGHDHHCHEYLISFVGYNVATMSGCPLPTWRMLRTFSGHTRWFMVSVEHLPVWGEWCSACTCFCLLMCNLIAAGCCVYAMHADWTINGAPHVAPTCPFVGSVLHNRVG